jgi:hypothetical protein
VIYFYIVLPKTLLGTAYIVNCTGVCHRQTNFIIFCIIVTFVSYLSSTDGDLRFWRKARIPIQDQSNCVTKIKKFYDEWRKLDKNKNRNTDTQKKNYEYV